MLRLVPFQTQQNKYLQGNLKKKKKWKKHNLKLYFSQLRFPKKIENKADLDTLEIRLGD